MSSRHWLLLSHWAQGNETTSLGSHARWKGWGSALALVLFPKGTKYVGAGVTCPRNNASTLPLPLARNLQRNWGVNLSHNLGCSWREFVELSKVRRYPNFWQPLLCWNMYYILLKHAMNNKMFYKYLTE